MKLIQKTSEKIMFTAEIDTTLANAIRRSVNEIPILAIDEVEIYKNDSALYDEMVAHRCGLIPLKNQKLVEFSECSCKGKGCAKCTVELKIKQEGKKTAEEVLSGGFGEDVIYPEMPITVLNEEQEFELVAKARVGRGKNHAKFTPGLLFYRHLPKIEISKDGEKHKELAELYPKIFEFDGKLKVKNAWECDLDQEDVKDFKGITIEDSDELVFGIESWGQIKAEEIFTESIKALNHNLDEVAKALK